MHTCIQSKLFDKVSTGPRAIHIRPVQGFNVDIIFRLSAWCGEHYPHEQLFRDRKDAQSAARGTCMYVCIWFMYAKCVVWQALPSWAAISGLRVRLEVLVCMCVCIWCMYARCVVWLISSYFGTEKTYILTILHTYMRTYIHTCKYCQSCLCMYVWSSKICLYVWCIYIYIYIYIYIHTHTHTHSM